MNIKEEDKYYAAMVRKFRTEYKSNRDPTNGDIYIFLSKDRRRVRIFVIPRSELFSIGYLI